MKKWLIIVIVVVTILVISIGGYISLRMTCCDDPLIPRPNYEYIPSGYEKCNFNSESTCEDNGCRWDFMTDAVSLDVPTPVTCCPADVLPTLYPTDLDDPCQVLYG